ncbi:ParA family protein [Lachnospiraceae bacterium LCP25S3_G4]
MEQTKVICFVNNKGGSGKSTTCSNVGYGLAQLGHKVLFIDGDMQLNLTLSFFEEGQVLEIVRKSKTVFEGIKKEENLQDYILHTKYENVDIIPSSTLMSSIEYELFSKHNRDCILKKCMQEIKRLNLYDYILIDAPPTLGGWVMNILVASDYAVIPVEASPWGLFGLANMFEYLEKASQIANQLRVMGIVVTKVDTRKSYFKQTMETLTDLQDIKVFRSCIRVDSTVEWAQDHSEPVIAYKKTSRSAKEYMALAKEVKTYVGR